MSGPLTTVNQSKSNPTTAASTEGSSSVEIRTHQAKSGVTEGRTIDREREYDNLVGTSWNSDGSPAETRGQPRFYTVDLKKFSADKPDIRQAERRVASIKEKGVFRLCGQDLAGKVELPY